MNVTALVAHLMCFSAGFIAHYTLAHYEQGPVNVTALVAHLMYLAANGGLENASVLPDTFGTAAFVAVAAAGEISECRLKQL